MKKRKKIILLLAIVYLTVGCGVESLFTDIPIVKAMQQCVEVTSERSTALVFNGTILLGDFSEQAGRAPITRLTSDINQPVLLQDVPLFAGGVTSPDGKLFAYETVSEDYVSKLIVLDANGEVVFTSPWDKKWGGFYWLNNHQIEFPFFWDGYWQGASPVSDIIHVVTDQRETIAPELMAPWIPDGPLVPMLVVWKTVYDPTLSIIGYMRGYEPEQSFVLWDLKNNRELWQLNKWSTRTVRPAWTPGGDKLAVVVLNQKEDEWDRFELYLVDRDGRSEKWIDIKGYFKNAAININWSPNGRYLAIAPNEKQPLLILDTLKGELLNYCIPADVGYNPVIWSPDSTQILLPRQSTSDDPSVILDIINKQAAYITNNPKFIPIGWLSNLP
jgi:hypothetical protein